jgi:putative spermidine/putrescine transport system ATP-binding protein/spermidine/putrescine transport system ATP-binding protein
MFEGRIRQVGSPDEIYRRPADRFVASFVGDVNVLRARLDRNGGEAIVTLGAARISVPTEPLARAQPGDRVDLFVRPEQLRFAGAGEPIALEGTVAAHIYQGGFVNLYLEAPEVCAGRILVRSPEPDAITRWPAGTRVGVSIAGSDAMAFAAEPAPQSV